MFRTFKDYLFQIQFNYTIIEIIYCAYSKGEKSEQYFNSVKAKALTNIHIAYRRISPKRFKKYREKFDKKVWELLETEALTQQEYAIEKWHMDSCKKYKRAYGDFPVKFSDES